ncbi:hypothetical protein D9615_008985 [Tricholomella constricta]|uniref:Zn(2)-C6 fungal-type domain-containing protein n=1 Tax=Tricholomella constricta TaxID=117010 RepID=A0A8H5LYH1_9AGAR|nr:hypothetical protein D9615_008985 [Tricholomella constricta]
MDIHHVHSLYPHIPYPMSRHEAELHWEMTRRQMRAKLETLPSSSFARTMLEEDELFYATFPLAKQAAIDAWISQHTLHGPYATPATQDGISSFVEASTASFAHECHPPPTSPNYAMEEISHHHSNHPKASPPSPSVRLDYDFYTADAQPNIPGAVAQGQSGMVQRVYHHSDHPLFPKSSSPPASPEIIHLASHLLVPSQRRGLNDVSRHLAQSFTTEPMEPASDSDESNVTPPCSPSSPCPMLSSPMFPPSCTFEPPQFTGDWAADAIAADPLLHAPRPSYPEQTLLPALIPWDTPVVDVPPTRRHHLTYRQNRNSRSRSRSHPYMPRKSSSPSMSRASSLQPQAQPRKRVKAIRDKDGKPIMACLFCRGRKIACGPPPPGSVDKTCNQCARRNLPCNYPLENRRGMRKPKLKAEEDINVDTLQAMDAPPLLIKAEVTELDVAASSDDSDDSGSEWEGDA